MFHLVNASVLGTVNCVLVACGVFRTGASSHPNLIKKNKQKSNKNKLSEVQGDKKCPFMSMKPSHEVC